MARLKVIEKDKNGANRTFQDTKSGRKMTRAEAAEAIKNGKYDNYHTRVINGKRVPASNPDDSDGNNLG